MDYGLGNEREHAGHDDRTEIWLIFFDSPTLSFKRMARLLDFNNK